MKRRMDYTNDETDYIPNWVSMDTDPSPGDDEIVPDDDLLYPDLDSDEYPEYRNRDKQYH